MNDDITSLIGLKSTDVLTCTQVTKNDVWYFYVTLVNHGARCQDCGTFSTKIKEYRKKEIDHAVLLNKKAKIIYNARRFTCPNCGKTFFEENPFTDPGDFTSQATIKNVLILLKEYNQTFASVARQVNLSKTEVMHIFDEHVQVKRKPLDESICLDEFYFSRKAKKKFALMILSFSHGNIIDILPSREKHSLHSYFHDIPIEERNLVRYVSIDMYDTYRDICRTMFPNALICVDSFHVMKWVSKALDDVRIRILHKYEDSKSSDEYYLLKYQKELLYMDIVADSYHKPKYNHHFRYEVTDLRKREMLLNIDPQLNKAFLLKDGYQLFNQMTDSRDTLSEYLESLIDDFMLSNIPEFMSVSLTLKKWKEEILNSFTCVHKKLPHNKTDMIKVSNGPIEGRNKYIKIILRLANGYKNFKRFRNRAMYVLNKKETYSEEILSNIIIQHETKKET